MIQDSVQLRLAAFEYLDGLLIREPIVTREQLASFTFEGERFPLIPGSTHGIHKPKKWDTVVSIMSAHRSAPRFGYNDQRRADGTILYQFQANKGEARNGAMLETAARRLPLIFLQGVGSARFEPFYPVWFEGSIGDAMIVSGNVPDTEIGEVVELAAEVRRRYAAVLGKRRLHQDLFRSQVLTAYGDRCAVCKLGRRGLLDAAHIIDDSEEDGEPVVPNGLALCRIHHGAYDQFLIGIRPDYTVEVAEDVLEEVDGPMLQHGLKAVDSQRIRLPRSAKKRPEPARLEWKYERFRARAGR